MENIFMSFGQPGDCSYSGNIGYVHGGILLSLWRNGTHNNTDEQRLYIPQENIIQVLRALEQVLKG